MEARTGTWSPTPTSSWSRPQGTLLEVLAGSEAGALRVQLVNFVQRREQLDSSPEALLTMTRRTPAATGSVASIEALVAAKTLAFVEHRYAPKWIARAGPKLEIGWGNHSVDGVAGGLQDCDEILCLHAPLRSKSVLAQKLDLAREPQELTEYLEQAWHLRRWRQIASECGLDAEWKANSYLDDSLDLLWSTPAARS